MKDQPLNKRDKAFMRLKCLELVIASGSHIDIHTPCTKAAQYFDFVTGRKFYNEHFKKTEEKQSEETAKEEPAKEAPAKKSEEEVKSPFGDSGRKTVSLN